MTQEQEQMIDKLCEAILIEEGQAFCMDYWIVTDEYSPFEVYPFDGLPRRPKCGSVACIGGSLAILSGIKSPSRLANLIGLSPEEADGLFHHWGEEDLDEYVEFCWPTEYRQLYKEANTPLAKAQVAVNLLQKIKADGDGRCLHRFPKEE